jgi:hypothetical protein
MPERKGREPYYSRIIEALAHGLLHQQVDKQRRFSAITTGDVVDVTAASLAEGIEADVHRGPVAWIAGLEWVHPSRAQALVGRRVLLRDRFLTVVSVAALEDGGGHILKFKGYTPDGDPSFRALVISDGSTPEGSPSSYIGTIRES